jgi:hypothetical protein
MRPLKFGVTVHDQQRASPGFTLFSPSYGRATYLIGMEGEIRHQWALPGKPGTHARLLPSGNLLAAIQTDTGPNLVSSGGHLMEFDWDGDLVWDYRDDAQHHDFYRLENGNTGYWGAELLPIEAAARIQGGRPGSEHDDGIWGDYLREVTQAGDTVWEWHAHEHFPFEDYPFKPHTPRHEYAHPNACFPLADGNILASWRNIDLIAIIERASGAFKWHMKDRSWGGQHDPRMLANGNITLFANGTELPGQIHSRVIELNPETKETVWEYRGAPPMTFFSSHVSGCHRLENGNTLICEGLLGRIFEVTPDGDIVWEYVSPIFHDHPAGYKISQMFRAFRYAADSPEIAGRVKLLD